MGNPVGLFQHCIPMETVPFALFALFGFTLWVHSLGSLSLLCQFSPSPCTAGQECWGGLCRSSMQNTRVGAKRTMQSRVSGKNGEWGPPQCVVQGGEA